MPAHGRRPVGRFAHGGWRREPEALQHRGPSHVELFAFDDGLDTMSGNRLELVGLRDAQMLLLSALDDSLRDRMLGIAFDRRRNPKRLVRAQASIRGDVDDPELTPRQRAGLVEDRW